MISLVQSRLLPGKILILADGNKDSILYGNLKLLKEIDPSPGKAFVCKNFACSAPVSSVEELEKLL